VLSAGLEASKLWIRESINLQRELVKNFVAARGEITPMQFQAIADYQDDVYESVEAMGATSLTEANKLTTKTARNAALEVATASIIEHLKDEFPNRLSEIKAAVRSVTKKIVRKRIVDEGVRIDGRASPTSDRSRPRSTSSR